MATVDESSLLEIQDVVNHFANYLRKANFWLSYVSLVVNIVHLLVLTRKTMRTTSTNALMIGIAISDILAMLSIIYKNYMMVDRQNPECVTSTEQFKMYIDMVVWAIQEHFRRCSSWLGVLMAAVRVVIVKNAASKNNAKYSSPPFGWSLVLWTCSISAFLSIFYMSRFEVIQNRTLPLPIACADNQDIYQPPPFTLKLRMFFSFDNLLILRIYLMFNAIVTKFIPCILFLAFTVLLLNELRRVRKSSVAVRKTSVGAEEKSDLTTKLIVFMTFSFFIAEGPLGMLNLVKVFYNRDDIVLLLSVDVTIYFTFLLTLNSISHFVFCIIISSHYRDTMRRMLGLGNSKSGNSTVRNKTSVISVQGIQTA